MGTTTEQRTIRCAIYTRKSTDEGLDQDFNSLDAQREAGEAYVTSQNGEGWVCLSTRYDDGGFSGGDMDRPALARLLADVEAGRLDCIVVYKVDRLSRSLLDFARIMETLETHKVSFVSVTQHFNTTNSMGRLTLNVLLSFAQFEREIIAERTSDKMVAARKKGKWTGGSPVLGYDVHPDGGRIIINEEEAERVRDIFALYVRRRAVLPTIEELRRRGWHTKRWTTKKGHESGGRPFTRCGLQRLLTNPLYIGKVRCNGKLYDGEHEPIIAETLWRKVQALLEHNKRTGISHTKNKYGALLKGLLHCGSCGVPMMHSYTGKKGGRRYRYYVCSKAQKEGWNACPTKSVSAPEIERFVAERIRCIGKDPGVLTATLTTLSDQNRERAAALRKERKTILAQLRRHQKEVQGIVGLTAMNGNSTAPATARLAELQEQICVKERRATMIAEELLALRNKALVERDVAPALADFDTVWETLSPREKARIFRLLIERVEYDGAQGKVAVTFRPSGIKALANGAELAQEGKRK